MTWVMLRKAMLVACVGVSVWPTQCMCFSHGASSDSCIDLKPGHIGAHLQYTHIPSTVTLYASRVVYLPFHTLVVSVRSSRSFMGFLLQARSVPEDHVVGGEFTLHPPGTHTLSCQSPGDTATHSDKLPKRNLSFTWRAPSQPSGDLRFYITVVHSYFVYGARIRSSVVHSGTRSIQGAGYSTTLPTKILSAVTDMHTTQHLNNTTATLSNNFPINTSLPQNIHTTLMPNRNFDTQPYTNVLTQDTLRSPYNNRNSTSETCNITNHIVHTKTDTQLTLTHTETSICLHNTTSASASEKHLHAHTSPKPLLPKHTQAQAGVFKHTPTDTPSPTTTHTSMHVRPHTHIHTRTLKHSAGPRPHGKGLTFSHVPVGSSVPNTHTLQTHTTQNTETTPLPIHSEMDRTSVPNTHTLQTHTTQNTETTPLPIHSEMDRTSVPNTHTLQTHTTQNTETTPLPIHSEMDRTSVPNTHTLQTHTTQNTDTTPLPIHSEMDRTSVPNTHTLQTHTTQNTDTTPLPIYSEMDRTSVPNTHTLQTHTTQNTETTPLPIYSEMERTSVPNTHTLQTHTTQNTETTPLPIHSEMDRTSVPNTHTLQTSIPHTTHSLDHEFFSVLSSTCTHTPDMHPPTTTTSSPTLTHTPVLSKVTPTPPSDLHSDPSPALLRSHSDLVLPVINPDPHSQKGRDSTQLNLSQHPRQPSRAPDKEGTKPDHVPRHSAPELGLLLGLSAALGMAVAVGLRYLQRKHCHKRTAMSLGNHSHDNRGIIHVQECGDLVQVRRVRQNSFLLLQTEYNVITGN